MFVRRIKTIFALFLIVLMARNAYATPRVQRSVVNIVHLMAPGLPGCDNGSLESVKAIARQQARPAARLRFRQQEIPHPFPHLQTYGTRNELFQALRRYALTTPGLRRKRVHFVTPGLVGPNGEWYSFGNAGPTCEIFAATMSSCLPYNDLGQPRIIASAFSMAHEVLHGLGARHVDVFSIMDPDPLPYSVEHSLLPVARSTIRQVRECAAD